MTGLRLRLVGATVLTPDGVNDTPLTLAEGHIVAHHGRARDVDLSGYLVVPGIVDAHGDGFERHLAPRRGAMKDLGAGLIAAEAELAANGITTAVLAQFYSWEGGMRGPEFAERVFEALGRAREAVATDMRAQLRFEVPMLEDYTAMQEMVARHDIGYVVFNDHLPHDDLEKGKRPKRLTGWALRIGRNPEKHLEYMQDLHARMGEVPEALAGLTRALGAAGVRMGSHDDRSSRQRAAWRDMAVEIAEFPETPEAVEAAHAAGEPVIMGAPNVVRGGSHNGNVSAVERVMMGQVSALASDYHYPSMRRAAQMLEQSGVLDLAGAWALISSGPAAVLGLDDRGVLAPGKRADLVVLDEATRAVCATLSGGVITYMKGEVARRFVG
jgi:alpha-D-ribose 1-methylphosphonate 5-triphosphate diphosphatase